MLRKYIVTDSVKGYKFFVVASTFSQGIAQAIKLLGHRQFSIKGSN